VADPRESPAFRLMELLQAEGVQLSYNDTHIPRLPKMRHYDVPSLASCELTADFLASQDCILIVTDHSTFDWEFIVGHARLVVDTRNATRNVKIGGAKICKA
jgi:UDP-N-acetyl-D-glucosamine dehydrogenase